MVGRHHQLDGHEFEQAPGVGDGLGSLVCCSPWGHKELDMTEQLDPSLFILKILYGLYLLNHILITRWLRGKDSACQCRRCGFDPWVRTIP